MYLSKHRLGLSLSSLLAMAILVASCGRSPAKSIPATAAGPTRTALPNGWQCDLTVQGKLIATPNGKRVVLHGANLPTLTEMEDSAYKWEAHLRDLAGANARVVRLPIDVKELTPTFVPSKVVPFVRMANDLGMIVILSWDATITDPVDDRVDDAEDWVRLELDYLNNNKGVWFDLYNQMQDVSPTRQRNIAQRLVDVARGFRSTNIILVNNPAWLFDADTQVSKLLSGGNIVYGVNAGVVNTMTLGINHVTDQAPFMITRWGNVSSPLSVDIDNLKKMGLSTIVSSQLMDSPNIPSYLSDWWRANVVDWSSCRK
ncbi:MAG TPA: cellulase family glycosylhydrolase [Anaerolineae bacterium]|jgi:hypothetical protein